VHNVSSALAWRAVRCTRIGPTKGETRVPSTITVRWMDGETLRTGSVADIEAARALGALWVDVLDPDAEGLAPVAKAFDLHPLAIEDCLHFPQRPKIDAYPGSLFLVWILPRLVPGDGIEYGEIDVFLGKGFLVTSHRGAIKVLDDVAATAHCILPRGAEWTLHAILDRAVDEVFPTLDYIADQLDSIEDRLLQRPDEEELHSLYAMKRLLVAMHKTIGPERDVVRGMARQTDLISQEAYLYFQDVGDHLARETYRDVSSGAMDIYLSAVNNRMNQIMKQLTVVATIFMPLTLLSGIYGMNITEGMWPPISKVWSFGVVIGSMLLIAVWMLWFFRRRKWW
jgi:magnesium transporter